MDNYYHSNIPMHAVFIFMLALLFSSPPYILRQHNLSPRREAEIKLNNKKISVDYGSPSMRGREIIGHLIPYGKVWHIGANKATHFTTEIDLRINSITIPKGTYTLFTIPLQNEWELIINKRTELWCYNSYTDDVKKQELARINMKIEQLDIPIEQFTISLDKSHLGFVMKFEWEKTRASIYFTEKH